MLKKLIGLGLVSALLALVFFAAPSHAGIQQATAAAPAPPQVPPFGSYTFNYSYAQPMVPPGIGAQGIQGPTVPISQLGVRTNNANAGANSNLGPSGSGSWSFQQSAAALSVKVYAGQTGSSTPATGVPVSIQNITTGAWQSATTTQYGWANFSTTAGWYVLHANDTTGNTIGFSNEMFVQGAESVTVYMLPSGLQTASVNNGPSGQNTGTLTVSVPVAWQSSPASQFLVQLLNASASGTPVIATAVTGNNGNAVFANLNSQFSYIAVADGYSNPYTGYRWFATNSSTGQHSASGSVSTALVVGMNSYTGTLQGQQLPAFINPNGGSATWSVTQNTVFSGGHVYLSALPSVAQGVSLTFSNEWVFLNGTSQGVNGQGSLFFQNSVVVMMNEMGLQNSNPSYTYRQYFVNSSVVLGSAIPAYGYSAFGTPSNAVFSNSVVEYARTTMSNFNPGTPFTGNLNNVLMSNMESSTSGTTAPAFSSGTMSHVSMIDSTWYAMGNTVNTYTLNITDSYFRLTVLGFSGAYRELNIQRSVMQEVEPNFGVISGTISNTTLNMTEIIPSSDSNVVFTNSPQGYSPDLVRYIYDNFTAAPPSNVNYTSWSHSIGGIFIAIGQNTNISYSYMDYSNTPANVTFNGVMRNMFMFNDFIADNHSNAQLKWQNDHISDWQVGGLNFWGFNNLAINYSYLEWGTMVQEWIWHNSTLSHDVLPYLNAIVPGIVQFFKGGQTSYIDTISGNYSFTNNTFGYLYYNASLTNLYSAVSFGYPGPAQYFETNQFSGFSPNSTINWSYNTFHAKLLGSWALEGFPAFLQQDQWGVVYNVKNNIFWNDPKYTLGETALVRPYAADIEVYSINHIENNWFLNLNNETVPMVMFGTWPGSPVGVTNFTLVNNHFFYTPLKGQTHVDINGPFYHAQNVTGAPIINGTPTESTVTYEIPGGANILNQMIDTNNNGVYIYNTSIMQPFPSLPDGIGPNITALRDYWSWEIVPSLSIINGSPLLSYQGMAGPQPNFTYRGHNYTESIAPNYFKVGADSGSAPPINLHFGPTVSFPHNSIDPNGSTGSVYVNFIASNGTVMRSTPFALNGAGTQLNVTYSPATDGLLAVVALTYNYSWTPPPPVVVTPTPFMPILMPPPNWWLRLLPYLPSGSDTSSYPVLSPVGGQSTGVVTSPVTTYAGQVGIAYALIQFAVFAVLIASAAATISYELQARRKRNDERNTKDE